MSSDIHALSGAYAVDALDDAERHEFEEHLATCPACRDEVADLRRAASELAAVSDEAPPAHLRDAVLAGVRGVRPLPPLPRAEVRRLPRRRVITGVGLAAAAAAIVAGGTTIAWHPWDRGTPPPAATPSMADKVMAAKDVQRYEADLPHGGTLTVYRSVEMDHAVVVSQGLGPAPQGQVYELWLQPESGPLRPAGLFTDGSDLTKVVLGSAGRARGLGISMEPPGGSARPTTKPMALVALT
jgi:anti-sigma-K factor RskA